MENIKIESTRNTPLVEFMESGSLKLVGKSFSEDPRKFWDPLISWCKLLSAENINLEVKLEYANTSSRKFLFEIIRTIDANSNIQNKEIKWYFEEDDDDMLEVGQIFEENTFTTNFYFHEIVSA
jgi:hypothetical protein